VPEQRGLFSSSAETDYYDVRRIDPRAMAAARRLWEMTGQPKPDFSLTSVIRRVATTDPLLAVEAQSVFRRFEIMKGMATNGGTLEVEMYMPIDSRYVMEQTVEMMVKALRKLAKDPVRYYMAALIDLYG